ncbi:MAG: DEAD/DEAH box helicase [Proteobacteria bacterium]|nr:DEAD/DEAH box helicase [Pseudomonadota bacterium]
MTNPQNTFPSIADAVARLRSSLARALAGEDDPCHDPSVEADLSLVENQYAGDEIERVRSFAQAVRDPKSIPGVSRSVVLARGQRFLLSLAIEIEDEAQKTKPAKKKTPKEHSSATSRVVPSTPFEPELLTLKGIGPKTAARLASRGITSPRDMLFLLPRRYDDRRSVTPIAELKPGNRVVTAGTVQGVRTFGRPWKQIMELELSDNGATLLGMWFSNRRPRSERFVKGEKVSLAGLVSEFKGRLQIAHPLVVGEEDESDRLGRIVPVYPEVPGVAGRTVEKAVSSAAIRAEEFISDSLPATLVEQRNLMALAEALKLVHLPPDSIPTQALDAWVKGRSPAHQRLAYDEFFFLQLALTLRRMRHVSNAAPPVTTEESLPQELGELLGITLTNAQKRIIGEIAQDMRRPHPMQRLLQGDVGSGKTAVALAAIIAAVRSGLQAALMAPTEILAEQHMHNLFPVLKRLGIRAALHIGQARSSTRKKNLAAFEQGTAHVQSVPTHWFKRRCASTDSGWRSWTSNTDSVYPKDSDW